ncbi:MAG: hypothetical protein K2N05_03840 [Muribaculaceae bacterium]|nr:hypothetical protein [Muribaculaceae bacterium]
MRKKKYIICLLVLLTCMFSSAAGVNKMFVQRKGEAGWVYHIFPKKMPSVNKKIKNLNYDFTFTEQSDSVTLIATVVINAPLKPNSLRIVSCGKLSEYEVETLYLIPKGSKYEYRLLAKLPFEEWESMYSCTSPYKLNYIFNDGSNFEEISFMYSDSKWKSKRKYLLIILNTIKLNTGK